MALFIYAAECKLALEEASLVLQGCQEQWEEVQGPREPTRHFWGSHKGLLPPSSSWRRRRRRKKRRNTCTPNLPSRRSWANMQMRVPRTPGQHDRDFHSCVCPLPLWCKRNSGGVSHSCNAALPHTCLLTFPLHASNLGIFRILFPLFVVPSEDLVCRQRVKPFPGMLWPSTAALLPLQWAHHSALQLLKSEIRGQIIPLDSIHCQVLKKKNLAGSLNSLQDSNSSACFWGTVAEKGTLKKNRNNSLALTFSTDPHSNKKITIKKNWKKSLTYLDYHRKENFAMHFLYSSPVSSYFTLEHHSAPTKKKFKKKNIYIRKKYLRSLQLDADSIILKLIHNSPFCLWLTECQHTQE